VRHAEIECALGEIRDLCDTGNRILELIAVGYAEVAGQE